MARDEVRLDAPGAASRRPFSRSCSHSGVSHSNSRSPPQMSLTRTSRRPCSASIRSHERGDLLGARGGRPARRSRCRPRRSPARRSPRSSPAGRTPSAARASCARCSRRSRRPRRARRRSRARRRASRRRRAPPSPPDPWRRRYRRRGQSVRTSSAREPKPVKRSSEPTNASRRVAPRAQVPQRLGVRPRRRARAADAPDRRDVVDAAQRVVGAADQVVAQPRLHRVDHALEALVDPRVVAELRRVAVRLDARGVHDRDDAERQVAVDVRVHPRQRELELGDAVRSARVEQRAPGARRRRAARRVVGDRVEQLLGRDRAELAQEERVLERAGAARRRAPRW